MTTVACRAKGRAPAHVNRAGVSRSFPVHLPAVADAHDEDARSAVFEADDDSPVTGVFLPEGSKLGAFEQSHRASPDYSAQAFSCGSSRRRYMPCHLAVAAIYCDTWQRTQPQLRGRPLVSAGTTARRRSRCRSNSAFPTPCAKSSSVARVRASCSRHGQPIGRASSRLVKRPLPISWLTLSACRFRSARFEGTTVHAGHRHLHLPHARSVAHAGGQSAVGSAAATGDVGLDFLSGLNPGDSFCKTAKSRRENVSCCVHVAVVHRSTITASPFSYSQTCSTFRTTGGNAAAARASLG